MIKDALDSVWVNRIARILLGAIFIYASVDKIRHPLEFARIIDGYRMLPEGLVGITAAVLPFLELICGILLVTGFWVLPGLVWTGLLLVAFMAGMIQAYARGLAIDCGCFSVTGGGSGITAWTITRDVLILLVWAKAFWYYKSAPAQAEKAAAA